MTIEKKNSGPLGRFLNPSMGTVYGDLKLYM